MLRSESLIVGDIVGLESRVSRYERTRNGYHGGIGKAICCRTFGEDVRQVWNVRSIRQSSVPPGYHLTAHPR